MLYVIGLGLGDAEDITVKGLNIIRKCQRVYLESYTSILSVGKDVLVNNHVLFKSILHCWQTPEFSTWKWFSIELFQEKFYGKELILADRELVEQGCEEILNGANQEDIAFLVVGDPFGATTHLDIILRAKEKGIPHEVVHNASIMNAVGCCGLQLYSFGKYESYLLEYLRH